MNPETWTAVENYISGLIVPADEALTAALRRSRESGLPPINVSPLQGQLLQLLARSISAKRILEIGTLGGYSTIWLARSLPRDGRLTTLEANPDFADVARQNITGANLEGAIDVRVGLAAETLPALADEGAGPFDFVFIDADKANISDYFSWSLRLTLPGSLIIVDNVVRGGGVLESQSQDPTIEGIRSFNAMLSTETRVLASTVQTVGTKGYDGFTVALVLPR